MVLINYATKEIVAKVVYYGPALCGKTTNLQFVYTKLSPKKRGKMISLSTESDRTLFFDFLPMELGKIQGFKVRFQLYTVPGQVFYGATRRLVLKGADAVVFVADSQEAVLDMNIESLEDMKQNLIDNNLDPETIPIVIQYNKRDLNGIMEVEDLEKHLNWRGLPYTEAVAITGPGVMETFMEVTKALIQDLKKKHAFIDDDAIKELPPDIFEQEKEPEVLEADDVVFEIEHGSGYRHETEGEEVIAGEMLDMVETISLADASLAEEFFDDVRKGVPTEEAKEKVMGSGAGDEAVPLSGTADEMGAPPVPAGQAENPLKVGERELTPEEIEFADEPMEPEAAAPAADEDITVLEADPYVEPATPSAVELPETQPEPEPEPEPEPKPKTKTAPKKPREPEPKPLSAKPQTVTAEASPETEKRFNDIQETLALLAKDVSTLGAKTDKQAPTPEAVPDKRIDAVLEALTAMAKDISALSGKLDELASRPVAASQGEALPQEPDSRIDNILEAMSSLTDGVSQFGEKLDARPGLPAGGGEVQDITPELYDVKDSLGRIEQEISALRLTLTMMKESTSNALQAAGPSGGPELRALFDELKNEFKDAFEGQDRLLLSILEAARESKKANADSHEKLEDALRYLVGNIKDGGKKKWL